MAFFTELLSLGISMALSSLRGSLKSALLVPHYRE
jgi:hypothetical protein